MKADWISYLSFPSELEDFAEVDTPGIVWSTVVMFVEFTRYSEGY